MIQILYQLRQNHCSVDFYVYFRFDVLLFPHLRIWQCSVYMQSVVHVSTGYSQVDKTDIDEVIYDAPLSPSDLINMTQ